jgi:hypothetical protein
MPRENCLAGRREIWRSVREWTLELSAMLRLNGMHRAPTRSTPCARHSSRRESSLMTQNTHGLNRQAHMRAATSLTKTERAAASERTTAALRSTGRQSLRRSARGRTSNRAALCAHAAESRAGTDPRDVARENENDVQQPIVGFRGGRDREPKRSRCRALNPTGNYHSSVRCPHA